MTVEDRQEAAASTLPLHDPYAALRFPSFRWLALGRFAATLGEQMVSVAISWELYERTGSPLALGAVGLAQVLPVILLALPAGHIVDRYNRKRVLFAAQILMALCSLGLALLSAGQGSLVLIYGCLLLIGVARAFANPADSALLSLTVPPEVFPNAAAWGSTAWQLASVIGPAMGGLLIAVFKSAVPAFLLDVAAAVALAMIALLIQVREVKNSPQTTSLQSVLGGVRFIWTTRIILATITLDMFAVLLGGATALMPVFAKDILHVGPEGLGWMRAAPSIGAVLMALTQTRLPPYQQAGKTLLWAVAGFGVATIVFGLSTSFWLSVLMLVALGVLDNISVVIRSTLFLTHTPDEMRGRASAVNFVFIGASNELGAFESGVAAALLGPILAVVGGGIGTILVVTWIALAFPEVRRLGRLGDTRLT